MDIQLHIITLLHLSGIFALYCILGSTISIILNKLTGKKDISEYETYSSYRLFGEILGEVVITGICAFYLRLFIGHISSFLSVYSYLGPTELSGGIINAFLMMNFQANLKHKINLLYKRYFNESLFSGFK
jgi:hypothetical protein